MFPHKFFYGADDESVILKDPEIDSVKSSFSSGVFVKTTGATKPNVRVHIRRRIVQIQRESSGIHRIIPIAAADGREAVDSSP